MVVFAAAKFRVAERETRGLSPLCRTQTKTMYVILPPLLLLLIEKYLTIF